MEITLSVNKTAVYNEVAQTTAYTGDKMDKDETAYKRIFTTDEDQSELLRFWDEGKNTLCQGLKNFLPVESEDEEGKYSVTLDLSSSFDSGLQPSMERSLFSFFVMSITAKWFAYANKEEAASYASEAAAHLEDIMRKAYFKKKPTRPTY